MSLPLSGRLSGQVPFSLSYWSLSWWLSRTAFLGCWRQENNESSENRRIAHFAGLHHYISTAVSKPGAHYCSGLYADVRGGCHSLEYLFGLHRLHRPRPCCLLRHRGLCDGYSLRGLAYSGGLCPLLSDSAGGIGCRSLCRPAWYHRPAHAAAHLYCDYHCLFLHLPVAGL